MEFPRNCLSFALSKDCGVEEPEKGVDLIEESRLVTFYERVEREQATLVGGLANKGNGVYKVDHLAWVPKPGSEQAIHRIGKGRDVENTTVREVMKPIIGSSAYEPLYLKRRKGVTAEEVARELLNKR